MNQPRAPKPSEPPTWSSDYFREPVASGVSPLGRGLVGHVPLVAIGLIVQGALELLLGVFLLLLGLTFMVAKDKELEGMAPIGGLMLGFAIPSLGCGFVRVIAGYYNLRYRRRGLGMAALGLGLLTMITFYCAPTSIGLAVYGLIVYLNESVAAAFAMAESGKSTIDIQAAFPPPR